MNTAIEAVSENPKLAEMREAMNDPLFLADLREVAEDFRFAVSGDGKSDSIAEIENYWGDASIDDIHARIMQWSNCSAAFEAAFPKGS